MNLKQCGLRASSLVQLLLTIRYFYLIVGYQLESPHRNCFNTAVMYGSNMILINQWLEVLSDIKYDIGHLYRNFSYHLLPFRLGKRQTSPSMYCVKPQ